VWDVYYVAKDALAVSFKEDLFVELGGRSGGHYQEHGLEIARLEGASVPL
jgi:hypothetical protein